MDWTSPAIIGYRHPAPDGQALLGKMPDILDTLGLPVSTMYPEQAWVLTLTPTGDEQPETLELVRPDGVKLSIDFSSGKARHRSKESGKGIQPLAKALGVNTYRKQHSRYPHIIDATGGLGQDAWALASLGSSLTVIERHPIVHALLANALERAMHHPETRPTAERITLIHGAAEDLLRGRTMVTEMDTRPDADARVEAQIGSGSGENSDTDNRTHAIYLDPMYPERARKKAESRKGMQFLHALLGPPEIAATDDSLLALALRNPVKRVVVKRPRGAEALAGGEQWSGQRTTIESPNTRFDVYHRHD